MVWWFVPLVGTI